MSGLAKRNLLLYRKALNLPFITDENKYYDIIEELKNSDDVTDTEWNYLENKRKNERFWAKCFIKSHFTGGVSTTSRVEGYHGKLKKYLTSGSNLQNVFYSFRVIEKTQIDKFTAEFQRHSKSENLSNILLLDKIKEKCSEYIIKKIQGKFIKALNYKTEKISNTKSW